LAGASREPECMNSRNCAAFSHLSLHKYHVLSDATMDALLEELEILLDRVGNPKYEVEYHVSTV
jgi:hypothetical protein